MAPWRAAELEHRRHAVALATNKPTGDNARKRAVRKRTQLKNACGQLDEAQQEFRQVYGREEEARRSLRTFAARKPRSCFAAARDSGRIRETALFVVTARVHI